MRWRTWAMAAVMCVLVGGEALACPYSVREAGFVPYRRAPYRLFVVVRNRTPGREDLARELKTASGLALEHANLTAEVVNLDDAPDHAVAGHVATLKPKHLPAAVLVSPVNQAIEVDWAHGKPIDAKAAEAFLEGIVTSPARDEIAANIVGHWCVVLLAKGAVAEENKAAEEELAAAARDIAGMTTEMGKTVGAGPHVIPLDPADRAERVLLWSAGLLAGEADEPRAAVLFGSGWRLGPVFEGVAIDRTHLANLYRLLGRSCACTSDWSRLLGPLVLRDWPGVMRLEVRDKLGFDPNSPRVRMTLPTAWVNAVGDSGSAPLAPMTGLLGYQEIVVGGRTPRTPGAEPEDGEEEYVPPPAPASAPASAPKAVRSAPPVRPTDDEPPTVASRAGQVVLLGAGALVLVAVVGGLLIWRRARGRA